jgi:cytochrome c-type biogenesis protein CcmF
MKDNNLSSNPDTRSYLTKDVFTYISYALNRDKNEDTAQFNIVELQEKDSSFYGNGYIILNGVVKNPNNTRYQYKPTDVALMADLTIVSKDGKRYKAFPLIEVDTLGIKQIDDTLYAQNLYLRFAGISDDHKIKLGIKESGQIIDFVAVKAYVFPFINLVWLGLIILSLGLLISMVHRAKINTTGTAIILILAAIGLFYMFLLANA